MNVHRNRSTINSVGFSKENPNEVRFRSVPNSPEKKTRDSSTDWQILGGPGRRRDILMELQLNKVRFQHEVYPENTVQASRQILLVNEIEIRDRLATSHINKFLYQYSSESRPRQSHANMFVMKAVHIRPDPKSNVQECCLKLSLLPLRLNIDQDSLLFLIEFFCELSGNEHKQIQDNLGNCNNSRSSPVSKQGTPTHHPPVISVNDPISDSQHFSHVSEDDNMIDQDLMLLLEEELTIKKTKITRRTIQDVHEDCQPIYFRYYQWYFSLQ